MNAAQPNFPASRRVTPGFNASLCIPPICYGVSSVGASVSSAKVNSEYRSVREQSGIYAGDGGYAIRVKGNTDLTGAVIASEADAAKNHLKTGTLTVRDLENEAHYTSSADSVSKSWL